MIYAGGPIAEKGRKDAQIRPFGLFRRDNGFVPPGQLNKSKGGSLFPATSFAFLPLLRLGNKLIQLFIHRIKLRVELRFDGCKTVSDLLF